MIRINHVRSAKLPERLAACLVNYYDLKIEFYGYRIDLGFLQLSVKECKISARYGDDTIA